jgi:hypothetical protein
MDSPLNEDDRNIKPVGHPGRLRAHFPEVLSCGHDAAIHDCHPLVWIFSFQRCMIGVSLVLILEIPWVLKGERGKFLSFHADLS